MNPRSLAYFIFTALIAGMLALIFTGCGKSPDKWEIVCDESGHYSYVDNWGQIEEHLYRTREEALRARDEHKFWIDDHDRRKREVQSHQWKACPPNSAPREPKHSGMTIPPGGSVTIEIPLFLVPSPTPTPQGTSL